MPINRAYVFTRRLILALISFLKWLYTFTTQNILDIVFVLLNIILPKKKVNTPPLGKYIAPTKNDSRGPCPALNALANHGYFPRNGKGITREQLIDAVVKVYNASSTLTTLTMLLWWNLQDKRDNDLLDLSDFSLHNGIEHDASIAREDSAFQPDQGTPAQYVIDRFLDSATGDNGKTLTVDDFSRFLAERRVECRNRNRQYTESFLHNMFGSLNSAILVNIFGGKVDDLRIFLKEERIPDGWQSYETAKYGTTQAHMNVTALMIETGIDTESVKAHHG